MIEDFDEFCLYVYVIVDEICQQLSPFLKRSGPTPVCSDSELIAMTLISECKGWDVETELLSNWQSHRDLFPHIPSQSRFNRRRRNLMFIFNWIRRILLSWIDVAQDNQCVIDSLPIPVVKFHLVPSSTGDWRAYEARFGKVSSKKETIFGYKLHLLVTMGGVIVDFVLAPANATDLNAGLDMLFEHTDLTVIGDKAYISAEQTAELWRTNRLRLQTLPRKNQKKQLPKPIRKLFNAVRQIIETVNGQLDGQFNIETNHAHTFWGLCTRLYAKLTAHTLCIYINRLLGKTDFLQIKELAFPN
jgi:hypothetical protein